jgi:trehalose 6-phosphate phosphatase
VHRITAELVGRPGKLLVVSDFDGTLSHISLEPGGARIVPLARGALRRLARLAEARPNRLALAILSGRVALDVAGRVRVGGLRYLGNHGLEAGLLARRARAETLEVSVEPEIAASADARDLGERVADGLGRPDWLFVEPKGPSVSFHYRQAGDVEAARTAVLGALDRVAGVRPGQVTTAFELVEGRRVVEIRPAGAGGKAAALRRLIDRERPATALVMGDDVTDGEAFRELSGLRAEGRLHGLAVAVLGATETPSIVIEAADVALASPPEAARLLSFVARLLERETATS